MDPLSVLTKLYARAKLSVQRGAQVDHRYLGVAVDSGYCGIELLVRQA